MLVSGTHLTACMRKTFTPRVRISERGRQWWGSKQASALPSVVRLSRGTDKQKRKKHEATGSYFLQHSCGETGMLKLKHWKEKINMQT